VNCVEGWLTVWVCRCPQSSPGPSGRCSSRIRWWRRRRLCIASTETANAQARLAQWPCSTLQIAGYGAPCVTNRLCSLIWHCSQMHDRFIQSSCYENELVCEIFGSHSCWLRRWLSCGIWSDRSLQMFRRNFLRL
jgi:hypothetical protein